MINACFPSCPIIQRTPLRVPLRMLLGLPLGLPLGMPLGMLQDKSTLIRQDYFSQFNSLILFENIIIEGTYLLS